MRVNSNLSELHHHQASQVAQHRATQRRPEQSEAKPERADHDGDDAAAKAQVAKENRAASHSEPLDHKTASAAASAVRQQIQNNPQAAVQAHGQVSAEKAKQLLS